MAGLGLGAADTDETATRPNNMKTAVAEAAAASELEDAQNILLLLLFEIEDTTTTCCSVRENIFLFKGSLKS